MRIIPVIDLKAGVVVRGVAGRRESYRPVESVLGCDATAKGVADAFVNEFEFESLYVADLDAIAGAEPNWAAYDAIASAGLRVLVDAGTNRVEQCARLIDAGPHRDWCGGVVVGLESLRREQDLPALRAAIGTPSAVFSLDLHSGKPLTAIPKWRDSEPMAIVDAAIRVGFARLIVLDLASIGIGQGVSVRTLCAAIRERYPQLEIISGGGVRDCSDLVQLAEAGCDAALVASALHDGSLTKRELSRFGPV